MFVRSSCRPSSWYPGEVLTTNLTISSTGQTSLEVCTMDTICFLSGGSEDSLSVVTTFLKDYQENIFSLFNDHTKLQQLYLSSKQELDAALKEQKRSHQKIILLQESLNSFHELKIQKTFVLEENEKLKKDVCTLEEKHLISEQESFKKIVDMENNLKQIEEDFVLKNNKIKEHYEIKIEDIKKKFQNEVESKSELLQMSELNAVQLKLDFQAQFEKYKTEMEDKVAKLQPSVLSNSILENQDIFRKKLLYEKQESEKEKAVLKRKIQELEQVINSLQARKSCPPMKVPRR